MKKMILAAGALSLFGAAAQAQQYQFKHEFRASLVNDGPTTTVCGVAIAPSGDLYWVTFSDVNSQLIHAPNAVSAMNAGTTPTRSIVLTEKTAPNSKAIEAGRGYNDIEIDSLGNIYVVGGGGTSVTTVLRKVGPAPTHTVAWTANTADRYQGIAKVSNDKLIATGFTFLAEINDADGTNAVLATTTGSANQRSVAFNSLNNNLYVGRNGGSNGNTGMVYSGNPSNPASYVMTQANAIPFIGLNTASGVPTQAIDFDANNNQVVAADHPAPGYHAATGVRIYNVTGNDAATSFTEAQYLSGTETAGGAFSDVFGVAYRRVGGKDYIAAAVSRTGNSFHIVLYERVNTSAVRDWSLYN